MSLEEKITADLKIAMIAKDSIALRSIRAIKAAMLIFKTDGSGNILDEANEIKLVQKLVKQRQDSLEIFEQQNREDLAVIEREEIEILQKYLPTQLSEIDLKESIANIIASTGAQSIKDMGKVIGQANQILAGKADGKAIAAMVKALLG